MVKEAQKSKLQKQATSISHCAVLSVPAFACLQGQPGSRLGLPQACCQANVCAELDEFGCVSCTCSGYGWQIFAGPAVDAGIGIAAHVLIKRRRPGQRLCRVLESQCPHLRRPDEDLASRALALAHLARSLGLSAGLQPAQARRTCPNPTHADSSFRQAAEMAATAVASRTTCAAMTAYEADGKLRQDV